MKIKISKPCNENWDAMSPEENGKFCEVCSKIVRDFSESSDEKIYHDLKSYKNICGRFTDHQLQRNIGFSVLSKIALGILISGNTTLVTAQSLTGESVKKIDFKKGLSGFRAVNDTIGRTMWLGMPNQEDIESTQPLIFLDNMRISESKMMKLKPETIKSVNVLSSEESHKKYGQRGAYGAILIESKRKK
ncbi:hypothetical protein GSF70_10790 [Flavobacteriaceae bacterium W22]|nr:hypothetical protein [Flavobacteriaceae bacterium W22]